METIIKTVKQPEKLKVPLYIHQKYCIYRMEQFENLKKISIRDNVHIDTRLGVLHDPPGTGKTLCILGLITRDNYVWNLDTDNISYINNTRTMNLVIKKEVKRIKTTLIVVPPTILYQWKEELEKTTLKYKIINTVKDMNELEKYDVVVCSSTQCTKLLNKYKDYEFKRFIYDEADNSHIPGLKKINANFIWLITNSYSLFSTNVLYSRYEEHFFKSSFCSLLKNENIKSNIFRLIIESPGKLIKDIPYNVIPVSYTFQESSVILEEISLLEGHNFLNLSMKQIKINEIYNKIVNEQKLLSTSNRITRESCQKRLEDFKKKKEEIERTEEIREECQCCYTLMKFPVMYKCCQYIVCNKCVRTWLQTNNSCPHCRNINPVLLYGSSSKTSFPLSKEKQLIEVCKEKTIIYVSAKNYMNLLTLLRSNLINGKVISGTSTARTKIITEFKTGKLNVIMFINSYDFNGANLQEAKNIIIWDELNICTKSQLIGTVKRIGVNHDIKIHAFNLGS